MATTWRKRAGTLLKIAVSAVLVYFILTKIDLDQVSHTLRKAHWGFLFLALCGFVGSKFLAAYRLNLYFHQIGAPLSTRSNLKLYLLGMFYNLFLPGGIGGDAYKGYLVHKQYGTPGKRTAAALVFDRLSGLLLLFLYACLLALFLEQPLLQPYRLLFLLGIGAGIGTFWLLNRMAVPYLLPVFWKSQLYSAGVQLAQLGCAFFIIRALGIPEPHGAYLFVFLVSSIVAVLPVTLGGIGSREVTFYYGALWLGLQENASIGISVTFFLITALVSLCGLGYHFRRPALSASDH